MSDLVSILVPVYDNAPYLVELVDRIRRALDGRRGYAFEIVFANDGSRDDSWGVIQGLAAADRRIKALRLSRNFGQHAAISAALEHASGDLYVLMDADLQDRPEMIPALLDKMREGGHDIVYTLKMGGGEGWVKRSTSRAFHSFVGKSTKTDTVANIGTFRAFNHKVAGALLQYRERAIVYGPLMHTLGYDTAFLPVDRDERMGSRSSYSFRKRMALAFQSIVSYSTLPQRALLWTGGAISTATFAYLAVVVAQRLLGFEYLAEGLTLLTALLLFFIGVVMFSLGILGWYLFLIYSEVLSRPRYHVQQACNLPDPENADN
jgi:dolichol-phosphate mannosyltransferase